MARTRSSRLWVIEYAHRREVARPGFPSAGGVEPDRLPTESDVVDQALENDLVLADVQKVEVLLDPDEPAPLGQAPVEEIGGLLDLGFGGKPFRIRAADDDPM